MAAPYTDKTGSHRRERKFSRPRAEGKRRAAGCDVHLRITTRPAGRLLRRRRRRADSGNCAEVVVPNRFGTSARGHADYIASSRSDPRTRCDGRRSSTLAQIWCACAKNCIRKQQVGTRLLRSEAYGFSIRQRRCMVDLLRNGFVVFADTLAHSRHQYQ